MSSTRFFSHTLTWEDKMIRGQTKLYVRGSAGQKGALYSEVRGAHLISCRRGPVAGLLTFYSNKPDGVTVSILVAKLLDVSINTTMKE